MKRLGLYFFFKWLLFGHPKFDSLVSKKCLTKYNFHNKYPNKKIIVFKIHFKKEISANVFATPKESIYFNFFKSSKTYKNVLFILLLHPKYIECLNEKELNDFKLCIKSNNIIVFKDDDYREVLYNADCFICDRSSVFFEACSMGKPVLFLKNDKYTEPFDQSLLHLMEKIRKGDSIKDIELFINDFLSKKIDVSQITKIYSKTFPYNDGEVSKRIINNIKEQMKI
jgi:CDP-glycerol glycerophosphotransferase (TagB/SpsB family)